MQTLESGQITVRKSGERGHAQHGWLDSRHTFSFGEYHDSHHLGFRSLRVINDDHVAAGMGFGAHPHRDMEIFSYVISGALQHKDSLGNGRTLLPGQIQLMSAGTGVTHSEFNPSRTEPIHFLQVWIQPAKRGLKPHYSEWHPTEADATNPKVLVISPDGRDGSAAIAQDADVWRLKLRAGESVSHSLREGRALWLQLATGALKLNDTELAAGDGASSEIAGEWRLAASTDTEALLFDLA